MNLDEIRKDKWMLVARVRYLHDHMDEAILKGKDLEWIQELNKCSTRYLELIDEQLKVEMT
jgi:hypothetical protein